MVDVGDALEGLAPILQSEEDVYPLVVKLLKRLDGLTSTFDTEAPSGASEAARSPASVTSRLVSDSARSRTLGNADFRSGASATSNASVSSTAKRGGRKKRCGSAT